MKRLIPFSLLAIVIFAIIPIPNSYNPITEKWMADDFWTNLHECAHHIDKESNSISQTKEFEHVIKNYRDSCSLQEEYCFMINNFPGVLGNPLRKEVRPNLLLSSFWQRGWGGYRELYARIFQYSFGNVQNMPKAFQSFYKESSNISCINH